MAAVVAAALLAVTAVGAASASATVDERLPAQRTAQAFAASSERVSTLKAATAASTSFSDVPPSHPAYDAISWMALDGISRGYPDGTFRPNIATLRGHMAVFLYRLAGEPAFTPPSVSPFRDVPTSHPAYAPITWLAAEGISAGYPDGTFRPDVATKRGHMAVFLYRMDGEPAFLPPAVSPFSDASPSHPAYQPITWLAAEGISKGYPDDTFRPQVNTLRGHMALFMYRFADPGPRIPGDGIFQVGVDIQPGTYYAPADFGYWARLSDATGGFDAIIANWIGDGQAVVEIKPTDAYFETSDMGTWRPTSELPVDPKPQIPGDGVWIVGVQIQPGTYRGDADFGYWARLSDATGELDAIIANWIGDGQTVVEIKPTDRYFETSDITNWQKTG